MLEEELKLKNLATKATEKWFLENKDGNIKSYYEGFRDCLINYPSRIPVIEENFSIEEQVLNNHISEVRLVKDMVMFCSECGNKVTLAHLKARRAIIQFVPSIIEKGTDFRRTGQISFYHIKCAKG